MATPLRPPLIGAIPIRGFKVSIPIDPEHLPRIESSSDQVRLFLQIPCEPGHAGMLIVTRINAKSYRKALAAVHKCGGECKAILQGQMLSAGELSEAALQIQPKPAPAAVPSK